MTRPGRTLPRDVVEHWPEVFGEVKLNVLPFRYLHTVLINFKDGKSWEIRITANIKRNGWDSFEQTLSELFNEYDDRIENIDFKLDTERVKKDVTKSTEKFLKRKLI